MRVYVDVNSAGDFNFWSGAKDTIAELTDKEVDTILWELEEIYPDGMSDGQLNDFFWFERDTIAEWLGYQDFDQIMHINQYDCDGECEYCDRYQCPHCENEPDDEEDEDEDEED